MKKQKSTIINISEVSSSDDESQAKPKIDEEELKKYIKDSEDESSQEQMTPKSSPQKPIKVKRLKTPRLQDSPIIQPKKSISKELPQNYLFKVLISKSFRKRQRNLVLIHYSIPKENTTNTWLNTMTKRFILVLPKL